MSKRRQRDRLGELLAAAEPSISPLVIQRQEFPALAKESILSVADEAGWRLRDEQIEGNEWRLVFQPGARVNAAVERNVAPEELLLSRLATAQPDLTNRYRVDVTPLNGIGNLRPLREMVEARGWVWERPKTDSGRTYWILYRPENPPIGEHHRHFLRGPGLASLRDNSAAVEAATDYAARTGVNPLSDNELRDAYQRHCALMRRFRIWGNVTALVFAIPLLVTFLLTARTFFQGEHTTALAVVYGGLLAGLIVTCFGARRAFLAHRQGVATYQRGYELAVRATLPDDR
ncbi:MAG: hypothetical protein ACRDQ5_11975 [Sciscionella sp.]